MTCMTCTTFDFEAEISYLSSDMGLDDWFRKDLGTFGGLGIAGTNISYLVDTENVDAFNVNERSGIKYL